MEMLSLRPFVRREIWGGTKLMTEYGFPTKDDNIAEAWMLSCQDKGPSVVSGGRYDGMTLPEVIEAEGKGILGEKCADSEGFPILIKLIDARRKLSIQVHPDDEYAHKKGLPRGKTEAWLVLETEPGAELIFGTNRDLTPEEFAESIENDTVTDDLNAVAVKPGDVAFIPSRTIHAIGAGILLAEVQQNSDTTYRIYDYGRPDKDGNPRELHVEDAKNVANLSRTEIDFSPAGQPEKREDATVTFLAGCEYFRMTDVELDGEFSDAAGKEGFVSLLVVDGAGSVSGAEQEIPLWKGSCVFIPAGFGAYTLRGEMKILKTEP